VWVACEALVLMWRAAHPNTQALWEAADDAVRQAIARPGETFTIGEHLRARVDGAWLRLRLPSGRYLCYTQPEVSEKGEISYMGVDQYTRQWKRVKTYGGKLIENCTQAFARDIMAANMQPIEDVGYEIVLSVHDELLTETPDTDDFNHEGLSALLSAVPPWAAGIPLAAAGFETYRYRKD
jgi:DNA polymerase